MFRNGNASILPQETQAFGRAAFMKNLLWMDDKGIRIPIKYAYMPDMPQKRIDWEEKIFQMWASKTCLTFQRQEVPKGSADDIKEWCYHEPQRKENKLAIFLTRDDFRPPHGVPQEVGPRCVDYSVNKLMGRGLNAALVGQLLGLAYVPFRPDRDEFLSFNFEHIESLNNLSLMKQRLTCYGKASNVPLPMDFLSVMGWYSYIWTTADCVPVQVSRDPYQQYLFEYKDYQAPPTSPLDVQTLNMMYKCIPEWESACKASGKEVPKCKNFGYVSKECVCICLPVYSGKLCENKISTNFPYPLQEGAFNYTISARGKYDLGKLLPITTPKDPSLSAITFIIVKLEPRGSEALPFISVRWRSSETWKKYIKDEAFDNIQTWDCSWGVRMLWGSKNLDGGRRLACECVSVLGFNEFKENARVLSARSGNMTLTFINRLGAYFGRSEKKEFAIETSQYILEAQFRPPPALIPKQNRSEDDGGTGGALSNGTESSLTATAAAMTATAGAGSMAAVIGAVTALVLLCLLLLLLMKRRKKKKKLGDLEEEEEESDGSASESN